MSSVLSVLVTIMIWVWLLLSCQFGWLPPGRGAFHVPSATWYTATNLRPEASFGFSITYEPTSKELIVGAPQGNNIGEIYSCNIDDKKCTRIIVPNNMMRDDYYNHNYWLGAVVKAGPSYFVTCAPLSIERKTFYGENKIGTFSHCYKYTNSTKLPVSLKSLSDMDRNESTSVYEHNMDSFGWSIDVADNNDIMIGSPAMFTGRAIKYFDTDKNPVSLTGRSTSMRETYNFGYSVVTGYFSTVGKKNLIIYAVGSPYGRSGYGSVSFYMSIKNSEMSHQGDLISSDEYAVGSMFGAVLCAVRLTPSSKTTALVVGAPTYAKKHMHNVGAVYIYEAGKLPLTNLLRKIEGQYTGAFFGSAIVSAGDLNGDGMDEIAIGAPHEGSGSGAVYVYSSKDIVNKEKTQISWMQKIVAEPNERQKTFGLSLAAVQDYDENGCNELAIGAPETNKVRLVRSIASVTVRLYDLIPDLRKFKGRDNKYRNDTHFYFTTCLEVIYPEKPKVVIAQIRVQVQIIHPDAKLASPTDKEYNISLDDRRNSSCRQIYIETPEGGNYGFPIKYEIKARQIGDPVNETEFNASRVVLSDQSQLSLSSFIRIAECNETNNCQSKLNYKDTTVNVENPYVIGSTETIEVDVAVSNEGEVAYDSCLRIAFENAPIKQMPQECERLSGTQLKCAPKQALRSNATWSTKSISLEVTHLTNKDDNITIHIDMYNQCKEISSQKSFSKVINLITDDHRGIFIKGVTDTGQGVFVNLTSTDVTLGKAFEHSYTINNAGPTNWLDVTAKVVVQKRSFVENYTIILSMDGTSLEEKCNFVDENDVEATFSCKIERLFKTVDVAKITVPMFLKPGEFNTAIEETQSTVYTKLILDFNGKEMKHSVVCILHLIEASVPIWIILCASILGLIILFIFILILRECGFFRRQKKENLEQVRRNVKRQTIIRQSMTERVHVPPGADQECVIEPESSDQPAKDRRMRVDDAANTS